MPFNFNLDADQLFWFNNFVNEFYRVGNHLNLLGSVDNSAVMIGCYKAFQYGETILCLQNYFHFNQLNTTEKDLKAEYDQFGMQEFHLSIINEISINEILALGYNAEMNWKPKVRAMAQQSEIVEKAPLPIDYKFYLFSELVNDLMLDCNHWDIPCDVKFPIIMEAYERFCEDEGNEEYEGGLYDFTHSWINDDETMYSDLRDSADS